MGKADELLKSVGGSIMESASHRAAPVAMPAATASALGSGPLPGVSRSRAAMEIPVGKIEPDPDQPREEFDEEALDRLAESIRTRGQLQPIAVRLDQGRGVYVIVAGERRWRAAGRAGLPSLTCVVLDKPLSPGELLALQCVENLLREDLRPVEQAKAFRTLMTTNGWSGNELAKQLGIAQSGVVQALKLLELADPIQARVEKGELPASTAVLVSKIEDPEQQAQIAARVVAEGLSREETAEVVRRVAPKASKASVGKGRGAARGKARPIKLPTERKRKAENGLSVVVTGRKGFDVLAWVEALRSVLGAAESILEAEQGGEASNVQEAA